MIYCNIDPGLLTLEGLQPYQINEARSIVNALAVHCQFINSCNAQIPVTPEYIQRILESITCVPIKTPPIEQPFKALIYDLLSHVITPPLVSGFSDGVIIPDVVSPHVDDQTRDLWVNCITAALFQKTAEVGFEQAQIETVIAGQPQFDTFTQIKVTSNELGKLLGNNSEWILPLLSTAIDWSGFLSSLSGWPLGIDNNLLELFARHELGIEIDNIHNHRQIRFESGCFRDISREENPEYRKLIIEVIACRAYNLLRPEHGDHYNEKYPGTRRVHVKKMTPPIRFHYYYDAEDVVYCLYSNNNHKRGLR